VHNQMEHELLRLRMEKTSSEHGNYAVRLTQQLCNTAIMQHSIAVTAIMEFD
jgi:hypothetical protein